MTKSKPMDEILTRKTIEKENQNQIVYKNAFGIVFEKYFVVYNSNAKIKIKIQDTKRVSMQKRRTIAKNIFLLTVTVFIIIGCFYLNVSLVHKLIFISIAIILMIMNIYYKEYQYIFCITKQEYNIASIVKKNLKEDAKKIQRVLAEKLKKNNF